MTFFELHKQLNQKNSVDENIKIVSKYLFFNELLNAIYEVRDIKNNEPQLVFTALGIPKQILDMVRLNIPRPLEEFSAPVLSLPVLRRVYKERKPIYFKKIPDLAKVFIPSINLQNQAKMLLTQLGITDIGAAPIIINTKENNEKFYILCVLGPLSSDQRQFVKQTVSTIQDFYKQ